MTWEKEKAYCAKRAEELKSKMIEATKACDPLAFTAAYTAALRYMKHAELKAMMVMFVSHMNN